MKLIISFILAFIVIDILIVAYVIWRRTRRRVSEKDQLEIQKSWRKIIRQKDRRHAIMDADKLLDHALYLMGYKGNLGSKLKKAAPRFKHLNDVWAAHKVRNNIAHQMNYKVTEKIYRKSMLGFKQAFKDLKIF